MTSVPRLGIVSRVPTASVKRLEDPRLLTGHGCYLDDLRLPGLLHAAFVRSPHAHARLLDVEAAAALEVTGVVAAITGRDLAGRVAPLAPRLEADGFSATAWPGLAGSRVRFVGEPVALVAARTPYAAVDGCERVAAGYDPLPALAHVDAALAPGAPALHETAPGNVLFRRRFSHGDVEGAFARAAVRIRERFDHGRCAAVPLEPRGIVARWDEGRLTVWTGTQAPFIHRTALARALGLAETSVRVIVPDTGGGFGQKMHVMPEDLAVAALARAVGRPVKWTETRRENLAAASHAREARVDLEAAADAAGVLLGLRAHVVSDAGAYHIHPATQALEPLGTSAILPGPYRTPTYAYECVAVATNKPPLGAYRGVGMAFGAFVMERMLDLLADRLGLDPAEIRRRNLIPRDAYPFASAGDLVYDSGDLGKALEEALALAGYERLKRERDEARRRGRLLGVGLACYTEYTGMGSDTYRLRGMVEVPGPEAARVKMHDDASVSCFVSFPSQGQGHRTTIAQLVAAELGVPLARVNVLQPDTEASPPGTGTFASRGAVAQGGTAQRAAAAVRAKILALAARRLEAHVDDLELHAGHVRVRGVPTRTVAVAEIARLAHAPPPAGLAEGLAPGLEATETFDPPGAAFSGAVHVAAVEVDAETRRISVRDYAVVEDCGPVINPMIVEGQIHGALAQGIGEALGEELVYDAAGQLVTGTLMDYPVPVAAALPSFAVGHLETPSPHTPGGMKGMGEGGTVGAPAAIANAVADALRPLGVPVTRLPIRPEALRPGKEPPRHGTPIPHDPGDRRP
jgi:carbon-monoxide dehydrogenase large subunit